VAEAVALRDTDMSGAHDEQAGTPTSGADQQISVAITSAFPEALHARKIARRQHREHLRAARIDQFRGNYVHSFPGSVTQYSAPGAV
jgi:hypothetical protein